jgi:hypothetical protein
MDIWLVIDKNNNAVVKVCETRAEARVLKKNCKNIYNLDLVIEKAIILRNRSKKS